MHFNPLRSPAAGFFRSFTAILTTLLTTIIAAIFHGGFQIERAAAQDAKQEAVPPKPTLYLIGDSTVKCGSGNGENGQWGWGQMISHYFDREQIKLVNRAIGGRSSRTFMSEGRWAEVRDGLQPGDWVIMQFGHNDGGEMFIGSRPRASIKGNGDETREGIVESSGKSETVHSYGWYLRTYASEAKAKGAQAIIVSQVPRNMWRDGRVARAAKDYGGWARQAAEAAGCLFIDLNELVATRYEATGQQRVDADYFTKADHTHTSRAGAEINAQCVVDGIRGLGSASELLNKALNKQWRFDFGGAPAVSGFEHVDLNATNQGAHGFTLSRVTSAAVTQVDPSAAGTPSLRDALTGSQPFFFSVDVPEGNYLVRVTLGSDSTDSETTIKAESRRLMVERALTKTGEQTTREFAVNVRQPQIKGGQSVSLKSREAGVLHWDDKLTLEFNGSKPTVAAIEILPASEVTTVYLVGDSTVTDQPNEPFNSWGQMLPRFFDSQVAVANHAESGESIRSSLGSRRFEKVFSTLRPGDYLFFQFGHNDMKDKAPDALAVYRKDLCELVDRTRNLGGHPVLISSMERKAGVSRDTLGEYPATVRAVAIEKQVPLIDLHNLSKQLYVGLGDNLDAAFQDGTHHNNYGSYLLAGCVVYGMQQLTDFPLVRRLAADKLAINPSAPPRESELYLVASPNRDLLKPEGN